MATTNLVPTIESTTLPSNSANEWAETTNNLLHAHKPSTPAEEEPQFPGAFPEESAADRKRDVQLPPQDDVERAITTSANQTGNSYLLSNTSDSEVLKPPRPPFAANDTQGSNLSNLSTQAQAGSLPRSLIPTLHLCPPSATSAPPSTPAPAVPPRRETPPVLSKFVEGLTTPPPHTDSPSPFHTPTSASPIPVPARPHEHREHAPGESSEQSEGVPAPPNSLATDVSVSDGNAAPGGVGFAAGAPDVVAPPAPHGVLLPVNESSPQPKPDSDAPRKSSDSATPDTNTDSGTDTDDGRADGSPRRKKKVPLVQRLKEKIHIGH
ncbi:hypothetical protein MSAN_02126500 [Mycena sanguinolenta]|uniref:Uncharacterized protein n=1 Tax=Mycena sanguinolenta TaxID=230812 RepID=A0A8H6XHN5_9AGAR|nr:hypothetical protein MSAN_02126500 [Mycena sanguinolenta]